MEDLFDPATLQLIKSRIQSLQPDSPRQWGTMTPAQMLAHCAIAIETAVGAQCPPRVFIGRILGPIIKPLALKPGTPMRRNSPTAPIFIVQDDRSFEPERTHLLTLLDSFAASGPTACTTHPHSFFGKLTPQQWSTLMYKHLDHHLRQFNA